MTVATQLKIDHFTFDRVYLTISESVKASKISLTSHNRLNISTLKYYLILCFGLRLKLPISCNETDVLIKAKVIKSDSE